LAANRIDEVLNNPVWHALNSGDRHLGAGDEQAKFFHNEVSPFVALRENTPDNFIRLYDMLPGSRVAFIATPVKIDVPAPWETVACVQGFQMVHGGSPVKDEQLHEALPLSTMHCAEMLALTKLTNPGPFDLRTIEFGHYYGIYNDRQLVAMAGQRMHALNYAEISAVCTHPDHTGKGYARQLLIKQINRIINTGEIPYLHVKYDNKRALDLYQSLGFSIRSDMYFYILKK
jgi:GNAT superfamily N-acetyltransferase